MKVLSALLACGVVARPTNDEWKADQKKTADGKAAEAGSAINLTLVDAPDRLVKEAGFKAEWTPRQARERRRV